MKRRRNLLQMLVAVIAIAGVMNAQETDVTGWRLSPGVVFLKHFPGKKIQGHSFAGSGLNCQVRVFTPHAQNIAFTFGGGVNWFYAADAMFIRTLNAGGVGHALLDQDFNTFPLSVGVQLVEPATDPRKIMFFFGGEASVHFIDGNIDMNQQVKPGYGVLLGFAVSAFEFGVRYSSFSDIKNLGAQIGFRFASLDM